MRLASYEGYLPHFQSSTPYRSVEWVFFLIHFRFILMLDPKRECVDQAQSLLRTYFIELFFQLTSSPERYKTLISVFFFYQKMATRL